MEITAAVVAFFRTFYPEFSDTAVFSDSAVTAALEDGDEETGSSRWGSYVQDKRNMKSRGLFAFAAHKLVIRRKAAAAVAAGRAPSSSAKVQSKSVGDESVSFAVRTPDTASESHRTGDLGSTMYGEEFLRLRHRAGMGPAVV